MYDGILMKTGHGRNGSMQTQITRLENTFSRIKAVLPVIEQYNLMLQHSSFGPYMTQLEVQMNPCRFDQLAETGISQEVCRKIAAGALSISTFKSFHWMNTVIEGYIDRLKSSNPDTIAQLPLIFMERNFLEFELLLNRLNYPLYMEVLTRFRTGLQILTVDWEASLLKTWIALLVPLTFIAIVLISAATRAVWNSGKLALGFLKYLPGPSFLMNTRIKSLMKELGIQMK